MKKFLVLTISVLIIFSLLACSNGVESQDKITFRALVVEEHGTTITVQPIKDYDTLTTSSLISVSIKDMDFSHIPQVGDTVEIVYSGATLETYPIQLQTVHSVVVIK